MSGENILFADNDKDFLETRKIYFAQAGYQVVMAINPEQARNILETRQIDLAILDIRLTDDEDEEDISGLIIARDFMPSVPKIILTAHPTVRYVKMARRVSPETLLPATVDFISKKEGIDVFLGAVHKALERQKVFIIHGNSVEARAAKSEVALFLKNLGLKPIILQDLPNLSRTIIEKIEDYAEVGYAIPLLTPDDYCTNTPQGRKKFPRPRQNVVFEMGFFIGALGRKRVCALYTDGVEIFSDYHGVLYIPYDRGGGWKLGLVREMHRAGLYIDAGHLFE